jgi:hypothetical protein
MHTAVHDVIQDDLLDDAKGTVFAAVATSNRQYESLIDIPNKFRTIYNIASGQL